MEIISKSLEETYNFAENFLENLETGKKGAKVTALKGDLGSGKTTFVQSVGKALGIGEKITSPTFVILKKYPIRNFKNFETLVHIDAYRLDNARELAALGFEEEIINPNNIIFIEWPGKVSDIVPKDTTFISFEFINENKRKISFDKKW